MTNRHNVILTRFGHFLVFAIPVVIFFSYLFLAIQPDLGLAIPELVGGCGWIIILLAISQADFFKYAEPGLCWSPAFILILAAVFRCMFLWRIPELSDDIYRYLFDGLMTVSGNNPYAESPLNVHIVMPQMPDLVSPIKHRINHSQLVTIYPPAAQFLFAAGILFGKVFNLSLLCGMKMLFVILDLITCAIIIKILMILNLSKNRAVLYAWHPLPIIEIAASGHIDAAAIFFLMAAIGLIIFFCPASPRGKGGINSNLPFVMIVTGMFTASAILCKWLPLVFLPGLWLMIKSGSRRFVFLGGLSASGILILPFLPEFINGLHTLNTYLQNWEFAGFAFRYLRKLTGSGDTARLVLAAGLLIIIGVACLQQQRKNTYLQMFKTFLVISFAYLVLTPTLHPWYALYLTAFLPFAPGLSGLTLASLTFSWAVFMAYRVLILYRLQGVWVEDDIISLMMVLAPAASFLAGTAFYFLSGGLRMHIDKRKTPVRPG